jgi:hypothetical protein
MGLNQHMSRRRPQLNSIASLTSTFLLCMLLASCGQPQGDRSPVQAGSSALPAQTSMPTSTQTTMPTPTLTGPELDATKAVILNAQEHAIETSVASGTPFAPSTPIITSTPWPRRTPVLGISAACAQGNSEFNFAGCWNGVVGEQYVFVQAGAPLNDLSQGTIIVYTSTFDLQTFSARQSYTTPAQVGTVRIAQVIWPRMVLITVEDNPTTVTKFVFNLLTRTWEEPGSCPLYPIAVHTSALVGEGGRSVVRNAVYGTGNGNFGWLNWTGLPLTETLVVSLTPPGDSTTYINPNNPTDHSVSVGDWVAGRSQVDDNPLAAAALSALSSSISIVPVVVWDQVTGVGDSSRYRVSGFAWIYVDSYDLGQPNTLSFRYWGPATCADNP